MPVLQIMTSDKDDVYIIEFLPIREETENSEIEITITQGEKPLFKRLYFDKEEAKCMIGFLQAVFDLK